jgi:hypothetical protein
MAVRKLQLNVIKADGSAEPYVHTKVVGSMANALSAAGQPNICVAEELAEAVTFFLYHAGTYRSISTGEILSIIETALAATGFEQAAAALSERHFERKLRRSRVDVVSGQENMDDLYQNIMGRARSRWDKSRIVEDLVIRRGFNRNTARTIAAMVEERVLNMDLPLVPSGLVKQLVISAAADLIRAQHQLQKA